MAPDFPHVIKIRLTPLIFLFWLRPDFAKSLPCFLSQFRLRSSKKLQCNLIKTNILFWPGRMMDLKKSRRSIIMTAMVGRAGEHITDTHISETDTTELENLSHNIIDIFIIET